MSLSHTSKTVLMSAALAVAIVAVPSTIHAQEKAKSAEVKDAKASEQEETKEIELSSGTITMQAPTAWEVVEPRFNMIEHEYSIKSEKEEGTPSRMTIMASGGSIEANINRWSGQFSQPDGSSSEDATKVEEIEVSGVKTHIVSITGTFAERRGGPTAPPRMKRDYRMLGAIYETGTGRSYFVKLYGDQKTIDAHEERFKAFIKSMKIKD